MKSLSYNANSQNQEGIPGIIGMLLTGQNAWPSGHSTSSWTDDTEKTLRCLIPTFSRMYISSVDLDLHLIDWITWSWVDTLSRYETFVSTHDLFSVRTQLRATLTSYSCGPSTSSLAARTTTVRATPTMCGLFGLFNNVNISLSISIWTRQIILGIKATGW